MLSFPKGGLKGSASDIVAYVESERDEKRGTGYYSEGGAPSEWGGEIARELGLAGRVDAKTFKGLLEGRLPDGIEFAETSADRRMGKDLTFNAPKSVSLAALVCGDKAVLAAHDRANKKAMEWMQREFVTARYGHGGAEVERTGQAIWASYRHEDSRTAGGVADPHLHTHNVLLNVTKGRDGKMRALDLDFGVEGVHLAGAVYQAELAKELRAMGYELRQTENGFELASVTDEQIADFSGRSAQIVEELNRQGLDRQTASATQKVAANMATREGKSSLSQEDQRWEWRGRGRESGLNIDSLKGQPVEDHEAVTAGSALQYATSHLSERESVINSQSTKLHALKIGMLDGITIDTLDAEIRDSHARGELHAAGAGRLVTRETLQTEARILSAIRSGRDTLSPITTTECAHARIAAREDVGGFKFTQGQKDAVTLALTTQDQCVAIVGAAGAGKSTAMGALSDESHACGMRVVGLGPSQSAADGLREAGADDVRTLASFCEREDKDPTPRLIILDEAGMVSARDMDRMLEKVRPQDRVILVGDPRQLSAVEAGSPFAQAMQSGAISYSTIAEINRQKDAGLLEVAQAFADGRNKDAVTLAEKYMRVAEVCDDDWTRAAQQKEPGEGVNLSDLTATRKMLSYAAEVAKKSGIDGPSAEDFKTVRTWLDKNVEKKLGLETHTQDLNPFAPPAVKAVAIARETANQYLALSADQREKTLMLSGTNSVRRQINEFIREGLQTSGSVSLKSVTVTALDRSALTRAQLRQASQHSDGTILRLTEGRGRARTTTDYSIVSRDLTRNTLSVRDSNGVERTIRARDLDPNAVSVYTSRSLDLAPGDRVVFTENQRTKGFQNNETGSLVTVTDAGEIEVKKDNGEIVRLSAKETQHLDHGWAVTVHRSQGRTIDRALVAGEASRTATAQNAYVACSREKWDLRIITDNIKRLQTAWSKVAERETAHDALSRQSQSAPQSLDAVRETVREQVSEQQMQERAEQERIAVQEAQEQERAAQKARVREREQEQEMER